MDPLNSVAAVRRKIEALEEKQRYFEAKLEKAVLQKREGARYYQGTELPIDDAIFSIREGQVRSLQITLDFYRETLNTLRPSGNPSQGAGEGMGIR
ncbi:MAG: hypothetical protein ACYTHM_11685 [Planctomycetota bacterium]|jgi:hypothetical protein